jgi:hypothetical protein
MARINELHLVWLAIRDKRQQAYCGSVMLQLCWLIHTPHGTSSRASFFQSMDAAYPFE